MQPLKLENHELKDHLRVVEGAGLAGVAERLEAHIAALSAVPEDVARDAQNIRYVLDALTPDDFDASLLNAARAGVDGLATAAARVPGLEEKVAVIDADRERSWRHASTAEAERDAARQEAATANEHLQTVHGQMAEVARVLDPQVVPDGWGAHAAAQTRMAEHRALTARVAELERLAYIGEHHFPDLTWKARCGEAEARATAAEAKAATLEAQLRSAQERANFYAKQLDAQPTPTPGLREAVARVLEEERATYGIGNPEGITVGIAYESLRALRAAYDAAKGGEAHEQSRCDCPREFMEAGAHLKDCPDYTVSSGDESAAEKARKWDAAVERLDDRAGQAKAAHDAWGSDPEGATARWVLYGDTPPSGPGGGDAEHVASDDGCCALTCPACLSEGATPEEVAAVALPALTPESLAAVVEEYAREMESDGNDYEHSRAEGAREVLRRVTGGEVPRVLTEARVAEVLASLKWRVPHRMLGGHKQNEMLDRVATRLGLTLPSSDAAAEAWARSERENDKKRRQWAATHHGGPTVQARERRPEPTLEGQTLAEPVPLPMLLSCPACGFPHHDTGEWATRPHKTHLCLNPKCGKTWQPEEFPTVGVLAPSVGHTLPAQTEPAAPEVVWEGNGVRVLEDG